ncbi:general transcriptional corepressor trfA-like isoform X2 [Gigantopelta aegis]|uniref:general transcriptional corepressor trfA-like isoform X2 n=1 Tax=Gigantopelta aegis TaxID=1735272 RepID=UPI001B88B00E|nr:general transcriptional corepressor trfA-like isoform X2 [Gigantopelta aegis]
MARNVAGETKSSAQVIIDSDTFDESMPVKVEDVSSHVQTRGQTDRSNSSSETPRAASLSNKIITSRNNITEVAENILGTAKEMSHLNENLDAMERDLDAVESDLSRSSADETNNNINLGDTTPLEAIDDYRAREKAAGGVRLLTSSALDMLWTANEIIRHEREESDGFVTSTPRESVSSADRRDFHNNSNNNYSNTNYSSVSREKDSGNVSFQSRNENILKSSDHVGGHENPSDVDDRTWINDARGSNMDDRLRINDARGSGCGSGTDDRMRINNTSASVLWDNFDNRRDDSVFKHDPSKTPSALSELSLDLSGKGNNSLETTDDRVDGNNTNCSVDEGIVCNFGPKAIDSDKYRRDFESKEMKRAKWEVKLDHFSPRAEIVNRDKTLHDTQEQIYMSAGNVFSLEDRVRDLESKVKGDNQLSNQQMSDLQKEVAKAVVHVEHSENEVNSIERAVIGLQESTSPSPSQNSPRADTSSQLSSRRQSFDSGISSLREKVEPVRLVGHTGEDEVPESRGEYDADSGIELPSVNRLRAMFSTRREDDLGDGNFKRIHSITARSVSKEQLEKLRGSKLHAASKSPLCIQDSVATSASSPTLKSSSTLQFSFSETTKQSTPQSVSSKVNLRPLSREASREKDTPPFSRSDSLSDSSTFKDLEPVKDPVLIYPQTDDARSSVSDSPAPRVTMTVSQHTMSPLSSKSKKSDRNFNLNLSSASSTPNLSPNLTPTSGLAKTVKSRIDADSSCEKTKSPKIRSGSIVARTQFWEKRITEGSVNDSEIEGEFPDITSDDEQL